ncbi:Pachytene checkpoint protein 2, partial [Lobosporangium transversale]
MALPLMSHEIKPILHVEVRLTPSCSVPYHIMRECIRHFLITTKNTLTCFEEISDIHDSEVEYIRTFVERIWIGECTGFRYGSRVQSPTHMPQIGSRITPGNEQEGKDASPTTSQNLNDVEQPEDQTYVVKEVNLQIHVYQMQSHGAMEEEYDNMNDGGVESGETVVTAQHWDLPCEEFDGVWDSLIFEDQLQLKLLDYIRTTLLFSDKNVNPELISWN